MISEYDVHKKYRNVSKNKKVMNINKKYNCATSV